MNSLQGQLLVASTSLLDPNFRRAVVLIVRHNEEGAVGLILNRRTTATIKEVWDKVSQSPCQRADNVYLGGPCQGPLMAVHARTAPDEIEVLSGVYFTSESDELERLVLEPDLKAKFFFGYAGWGHGQLEAELNQGAWLTLPATVEHVFGDQQGAWEKLLKQGTGRSLAAMLKIKNVPADPSLN
jgi:putative transcriptional regulator